MSVQTRHWLDYDPVALVVLLAGMSAVALARPEHLKSLAGRSELASFTF